MSPLDRRLLIGPRARGGVTAVAVCSVLQSVAVIASAALLASIISDVFRRHASLPALRIQLVLFGSVSLGRAVLVWLAEGLGHQLAAMLIADLRARTLRALMSTGPQQLSQHRTGELTALLTSGLEHLDAYFARFLPLTVGAVAVPIIAIAFVLRVDWISALILVVTVPLIPVFMVLIGWMAEQATKRRWQAFQLFGGYFLDVLQGLPTLRLFGRGSAQVDRIRSMSRALRHTTMETLRIAFLSSFALELFASLGVALLAVTIAVRLVAGTLDLRGSLFVLILAPEVYLPLRSLGSSFHGSMQGIESARRLFALTHEVPEARQESHAPLPLPIPAGVRFERVTVGYSNGAAIMRDLSFRVAAGERVMVCGPSGVGKTTMLALILGLLEPQEGCVFVAGIDAISLRQQSAGAVISWLPQQPHLFTGTIADNVRLGALKASDAEVCELLEQVGATFVDQLPRGIQTVVGDRGLTLSGGQRQRLALARTLLRRVPIILLDEPLAALDAASRHAVSAAIEGGSHGRTVIVAAHATEHFPWVDRVVTLETPLPTARPNVALTMGAPA